MLSSAGGDDVQLRRSSFVFISDDVYLLITSTATSQDPEKDDQRRPLQDGGQTTTLKEDINAELISCVKNENLSRLTELHQQGAELALQDADGCTLLHHAVQTGSKDIVKYLIENVPASHLDLAETETGETALHKAAALCQRSICHFLVEAGASLMKTDLQDGGHQPDPSLRTLNGSPVGDTPKHRAAKADDQELANYLENCQHYQMIQREDQETASSVCRNVN
ncbi:hypothetical protein CCH79_00019634 [Gambusia affinis]|uniref:Uncharacterized protein n=1 Tax=Gambusia affinis TaxID=33528 RepID=A0A315W2W9_GAMAF|nr:hypothetical protein CCH79_00019634 [Gambusia affinis]